MSLDELEKLPSAELDVMTAERIMGWRTSTDDGMNSKWYWAQKQGRWYPVRDRDDWHPSANIAHAFEMQDKIDQLEITEAFIDSLTMLAPGRVSWFLTYANARQRTLAALLALDRVEREKREEHERFGNG